MENEEATGTEFVKVQRLKSITHFVVAQMATEFAAEAGKEVSKKLVAALNETVFGYSEGLALDLEMFARHANRKSVGVEDVRLCARRSAELVEALDEYARANGLERASGAAPRGKGSRGGKKRKAAAQSVDDSGGDDDDDNDNDDDDGDGDDAA